jgi:hypothetical protein
MEGMNMSESTKSMISAEPINHGLVTVEATGRYSTSFAKQGFHLSAEEIKNFIRLYADNPLFKNTEDWTIEDNPYRRHIDPDTVKSLDFSERLTRERVSSKNALAAHRMLLNIYESDLMFLPETNFAAKKNDFAEFYSNQNKLLGEMIRPALEHHVFGFLEHEITVTGKWTVEDLSLYLRSLLEAHEQSQLEIVSTILSSREPEKNALSFLIQLASDFLTEASATARNVLGKYGPIQSELFKIAIDDYGYGVHQAKHSTLFENTLTSCGLSTHAHTYWQFYLGSSLALGNYYHYVSRDHSKFFRCLGAIAYAEAMFAHTCKQIAEMLRTIFGGRVDTHYFDEHGHIDAHHGRMAFDNLVAPAIARYGDGVIEQIIQGLEEIRFLTSIGDEDFGAQIAWSDEAEKFKSSAQLTHQRILSGEINCPKATLVSRQGDPAIMRVNDEDKLFIVEAGRMSFVTDHDRFLELGAGEGIVIPRSRMHGSKTSSTECVYHVFDIGDYKSCLS